MVSVAQRRGDPPLPHSNARMNVFDPSSKASWWRPCLMLAVVVLCGVLPFADRAIYMDEHIFLQLARSAQDNWMFPADTPSVFFGTPTDDFAAHTHPPVGEYYLAIIDLLWGGAGEIPLRLSFSLFSIMAAIGFYALARRFTESPMGVTLLLVFSPAFFVMSHTIMMDMPMLAFLLVGVVLYLQHLDGRPHRLPTASLCFILAVGTGYTALAPVGCVFVWALYRRRPIGELAAIAAAPAVLFVWLMAMTAHFGRFPLLDTVGFFFDQPRSTFQNLLATFSFLGGVGLFPWTFLYLLPARGKQIYLVSLTGVGMAVLATLPLEWISLTQRLLFIGLASSGIAMTATAMTWMRTSSTLVPILLWVPTVLTLFIVVGDTIQARYLLPALPALYLALFRNTPGRRLTPVLIPTLVLSVAIAVADYRFVNSYRSWVEDTLLTAQEQGFRVWGASESGLRYYLEQNGVETLDNRSLSPEGGDLVVRQAGLFRYSLSPDLERYLIPLRSWPLADAFPLRTFNQEAGAGFHGSRFGLVPYSFSTAPHDRIDFVQLSPLLRRAPAGPDYPEVLVQGDDRGVFLEQTEPELNFSVRIPEGAEVIYDRAGEGQLDVGTRSLRFIKQGEGETVWWNLRVMPARLPGSGF